MTETIQSFTQLRTWQKARGFAIDVYEATKQLPAAEKYGLTSQLQRAAVSVAANIAEGFSRNTAKEKINFYGIALGSLTEIESHFYIASDLGFVNKNLLVPIFIDINDLKRMISGLSKSAKGKNT